MINLRSRVLLALCCFASAASAQWAPVGGGLSVTQCLALEQFDDGSGSAVYMATQNQVLRWDGQAWTVVGVAGGGGLSTMLAYDDGSGPALYAAGGFNSFSNLPDARGIVRLRAGQWEPVGDESHQRPAVVSRLTRFTSAEGPRLLASGFSPVAWDGSGWTLLGAGVRLSEHTARFAAAIDGEPELFLGLVSHAGGVRTRGVGVWDGRRWRAAGNSASGLRSLTASVGVDARLYGAFLRPEGSSVRVLDHDEWMQLGAMFNGRLIAEFVATGDGGTLFATGPFDTVGGAFIRGIAQWRAGQWRSAGAGLFGDVNDLLVFTDGQGQRWLFACGDLYSHATGLSYRVASIALGCALGLPGDVDSDGDVDFADINAVLASFGACHGAVAYAPAADLNTDGCIDFLDLNLVLSSYGQSC